MSAERYGRTWEIRLPWSVPPASANDRDHWRVKADKVRSIRVAAAWAVADAMSRWPFQAPASPCRIAVGLTYVPRDKRRRDPDNLVVPLFKALCDGSDHGWVHRRDLLALLDRHAPTLTTTED